MKEQIICLINFKGVEGCVNGEVLEPVQFLNGSTKLNPKHALWSRINGIMKRWIYNLVSISMKSNFYGKNIAFEMCQILERSFISSSKTCAIEVEL